MRAHESWLPRDQNYILSKGQPRPFLAQANSKLRTVASLVWAHQQSMIPGPDRAASSCVELRRQLGWAGTGQRARLGLARVSHLEGPGEEEG
jgi:hypothetical protein